MTDAQSTASRSTFMSQEEQNDRRKRIREIMNDPNLSQQEKNKQIQFLMDGRRRSSATGSVTWSVSSSMHDPEEIFRQQQQQIQWQQQQQQQQSAGHLSYSSLGARAEERSDRGNGDGQMMEDDTPDYLYDQYGDYRSVASSISDSSDHGLEDHHGSTSFLLPPGTYRQIHGRSLSLQDWGEEDRRAAVATVAPTLFADHPDQMGRFMEHSRPLCSHYERQCTIISPCCGLPFGCRICHDDCPVLPPPKRLQCVPVAAAAAAETTTTTETLAAASRMERRHSMPLNLDDNEFDEDQQHHRIDRFAIREIICRKCFFKQSSKT